MKLIIIDRKAWERHCSEFADFIHSIEQLIGNPPETDEWLDNEAVCKRLGIIKRTLQSYRDTGKIPFSMIGHKWKSHTNLTHAGKYFRPSKVKITSPTLPK